jgi:ParB family chromosome partitioning protein
VAQLVVARNLSVRETEKILESSTLQRKRAPREVRRSPLSDVEERLQKRLGTKVTIQHKRRGGRLIIHYYSPSELDGILEKILQ